MASWREISQSEPDFAEAVQERFDLYRHKILATLRKDGSPRISGIEVEFADGEIRLGMMPGSLKAQDLQRDPRLALHSGTEDPAEAPAPGTVFDAKIAGSAAEEASSQDATHGPPAHRFRVDVHEAVLITLGDTGDHLLISSWTERSGLVTKKRF